jgi:hypothetical protein
MNQDKVSMELNYEAAEAARNNGVSITAKHLKTGNLYQVIGGALNCTNTHDGQQMVVYSRDGKLFVRESYEFSQKFAFSCYPAPEDNTELAELKRKAAAFDAINTPEIEDFLQAVKNEALHQRDRWGSKHDEGKSDADWFWLIGYLAGKAIRPDIGSEKQLHHIITTAAVLLNWHAARVGAYLEMRPGTESPEKKAQND